ncbi:MAG: glycosyltransferase family 1 protein, partial [Betaproteobacteria bacterium]|nr:glycosyltransferase family 1 protein [Betaproteobacteria bacterium]
MQIAFCLYKYFPFGGLQRDFLRIALACQERGHAIRVYTLEWRGEVPAGFDLRLVPARGLTNQRRYVRFTTWVSRHLAAHPADR